VLRGDSGVPMAGAASTSLRVILLDFPAPAREGCVEFQAEVCRGPVTPSDDGAPIDCNPTV